MKLITLLLAAVLFASTSEAQKLIQLNPVPLTYIPKEILVRPTGAYSGGAFQIYFELRDTSDKVFETGNKWMPAEYFQLFTEDTSSNPTMLGQILLQEGLYLKTED